MVNIGDTVFVWWYGKPVQGMVVENKEVTPMLSSMVVVRIPIQGVHASALFMPKNVFTSKEQLMFKHKVFTPAEAKNKQFEVKIETPVTEKPTIVATDAYKRLQEFKQTHWDQEHNHIRIDALNDFYDLLVAYMSAKISAEKREEKVMEAAIGLYLNPPAAQPIKRIVSDNKMNELKGKLKATLKPKKQQPKAIQLSLNFQ